MIETWKQSKVASFHKFFYKYKDLWCIKIILNRQVMIVATNSFLLIFQMHIEMNLQEHGYLKNWFEIESMEINKCNMYVLLV